MQEHLQRTSWLVFVFRDMLALAKIQKEPGREYTAGGERFVVMEGDNPAYNTFPLLSIDCSMTKAASLASACADARA